MTTPDLGRTPSFFAPAATTHVGWSRSAPRPFSGARDDVTRQGERLLAAGADLIAFGRPFLANPDLVTRLRLVAPLNPVRDEGLMYVGGEAGYTDYPALTRAPTGHPVPIG